MLQNNFLKIKTNGDANSGSITSTQRSNETGDTLADIELQIKEAERNDPLFLQLRREAAEVAK
jgi:hypothetical protein